ncbi:MAG: hypothetical protein JWO93_685 [Micrococcaceae bacterium]|nr:hypothetical protein [Micrococcaceae bacterium]
MDSFSLCALYSRLRFAVIFMNDYLVLRFCSACQLFMEWAERCEKGGVFVRAVGAVAEAVHVLLS